jgi:hypothetical protein
MRVRAAILAVTCWQLAWGAAAQTRDWDEDFDDGKKSWKEIEAQIPAYPGPDDLVRVDAGRTLHQFYVDTKSVTLGTDGIVRYTAVTKAGGGATNVTFEGMRCETREQKVYALGHRDKTWARVRDPKWQRIEQRELTPHRYVLYREYFCTERTRPTPPRQAIDALRRGSSVAARTNFD